MDAQQLAESALTDLGDVRANLETLTYVVQRQEEHHREWADNQKWQINNMRDEAKHLGFRVEVLLATCAAALVYIAYKMP